MFTENRVELLRNLYVANVKNRLRELESPSIELQKRWIWELIQNAKDCCKESASFIKNTDQISTNGNKPVDIKIIYDQINKKIIFKHNGFPFMNKTLDSLMYKNSTKDNEEDNTGRFGTGFMTSHTLSRVVKIQAPFYQQTQNRLELQYIEATVYREGRTDKQLGQEFVKMEQSKIFLKYDQNNFNHKWTSFTYQLTNELGIRSAELGLQSFHENIDKVLLFCNEINSIQINNEKPLLFSEIITKNLSNLINTQKYFIPMQYNSNSNVTEKTINNKKFIVATFNEFNNDYSKKFAKDHEIDFKLKSFQFDIAFEIDANNQIVDHNQNEVCLFCTFPLVGSEQTQLPYLLNCPQFETLTERNGLILEGPNFGNDGILTDTGLNCLIIDLSIQYFSNILSNMCNYSYSHFSSFSNGLKNADIKNSIMKPFYNKLRSELEKKYIVFKSDKSKMMLKETLFLDFNNIRNQKIFHSLASFIYSNVASFEECIQWNNKTWPSLSVLNFSTFLSHISSIAAGTNYLNRNRTINYRLSNLFLRDRLVNRYDIDFLNALYMFIFKEKSLKSLIYNYEIILNANNKFTYLQNIRNNEQQTFPDDLNNILSLCEDWKDIIIHPKINTLEHSLFKNATINDAIHKMNDFISSHQNDIDLLLSLTQYALNNDFRIQMYNVAKFFYPKIGPIIFVTNVDCQIWDLSDKFLLKHIYNLMSKQEGQVISESNLDIYNSFYYLYQQKHYEISDINFLVPNVNFILKHKNNLTSISNISKEVFKAIQPFFNWDSTAHPSITSITFKRKITPQVLIMNINSNKFLYNQNNELILSRFYAIISLLPSKSNQRLFSYQNDILSLANFFYNQNLKPNETSISDESFWQKYNEIMLDKIDTILKQNSNLNALKIYLHNDEKNIFHHLNIYYNLISSNNHKRSNEILVPTIKGQFVPAEKVSLSKGVSDELFELYNMINPETDIKDKIAHPEIQCSFINTIDFQKFLYSICADLSDEKLIHDSKIVEAISNLKLFQVNSSNQNDLLLEKLYIANIKNRLNEIQNPSESDKARWPWELIQNAKDSLYSPSNLTGQKRVTIFIDANNQNNELVFSHNGPPFTENSYFGLLYKISQEKENSQTVGRFGTGFVSTHVLSKIVEINGNKIDKNGQKVGFSVTIHREGLNDSSISHDFKEMQKSLQIQQILIPYTSFKYKIISDKSKECLKLGLESFKNNISFVLINCYEIKFIILKENGKSTKYHATKKFIKKINNYSFYIYTIFMNNNIFQKYVVLLNDVDQVHISLKISKFWEIIHHVNSESLFTIFPLVGSKEHILPFLINSPKFEPVTERNALYLSGDSKINGEMTNTGKNKYLLMKSLDLYKCLIQVLIENKCPNMYELSRGLLLSQKPYNTFDMEWYSDYFLKNMRDILATNITVQSISGPRILLKDAFFPAKKIYNYNLQQFLNLSEKYFRNMISKEDAIIWKDKIWESLNICSLEILIKAVENDTSLKNQDKIIYLNNLLDFIWKYDKNMLYNHKLIPDMNTNLHCLSKEKELYNDLKECKSVPYDIIQMMESIEIPWKSTHMNNKITSISLPEDKIIDAESRINEQIIKNNCLSLQLMRFVIKKNEFRQKMYEFVYELKLMPFKQVFVDNLNTKIWKSADEYVIKIIAKRISTFCSKKVQKLIVFINTFLQFCEKYKFNYIFKSFSIFPNANYNLKSKNDLKRKSNFHDYLNPIMIKYFNKDFNDDILNPQICINLYKDELISDYFELINKSINNLNIADQILISEYIICLIPTDENQTSKQNIIFSLHHDLINPKIIEIPIPFNLYKENLWENVNSIILRNICNKIQDAETLSNFQSIFSIKDENKCFEILNSIYEFDVSTNFKIIPNKNGIFMYNKDLSEDPEIGDDLFECISILNPQNNCEYEIADHRVQNSSLKKFNAFNFYKNLNQVFIEAIKNPNKNSRIFELVQKITHVNDQSFYNNIASENKTEEEKARNEILQEAHVSFIKNRLRELNTPNKKDFQRWPFELIQNANDSILSTGDFSLNKKVNIEFEFSDNKVIFRHNGSPFKYKSLMALLYQCSDGKEDNLTTGRFGTGFMSTCVLSRVIHISGDVQTNFNNIEKTDGFEVTIYRDGDKKKDLKGGVNKMEKSLKKNCKIKGITTFEYNLDPNSPFYENSKKSFDKGLESLKNNISPVLILNPTIDSITIKYKGQITTYKANFEKSPIQSVTIKRNDKIIKTIKYLLFNTLKTFRSNNVHVDCLLQIGPKNNIFNQNDKDNLFISYPLICTDQFSSPIIINSQEFEPTKERDSIIIQFEQSECESYDSLINKFILKESVNIYSQMINYIIQQNNFNDLFNLCIGLKREYNDSSFENEFIKGMRNALLNSTVFDTKYGLKQFNEIMIPYIENYDDFEETDNCRNEIYKEFYDLLSQLSIQSKFIVTYESSYKWSSLIWKGFPSKVEINNLFEIISNFDNINELPLNNNDYDHQIKFIKDLLYFAEKMKNTDDIFTKNKLLINGNGDFVSKKSISFFKLPSVFIEMLNIVSFDFNQFLLHEEIQSLYKNEKIIFNNFKIIDAINTISDLITYENSIKFMRFTIKKNEKRKFMFQYSKIFGLLNDIDSMNEIIIDDSSFDEQINEKLQMMFQKIYKNVIKQMIDKIKVLNISENIDILKEFIKMLKENKSSEEFDKLKVFPNQENQLCTSDNLFKDEIKDENIKNIIKELFNINLQQVLIHDSFKDLIKLEEKNLLNISQKIQSSLQNEENFWSSIPPFQKNKFYTIVFQYSSIEEEQRPILSLLNFFFKIQINTKEDEIFFNENHYWSSGLTKTVIKIVIHEIIQHISQYSNIKELICDEEDEQLLYRNLSILYSFSLEEKIFPNIFGQLKTINEIYLLHCNLVSNDILNELLGFLIEFQKSDDIKYSILNESIEIPDQIKNQFKLLDITFLSEEIMKIIQQNETNIDKVLMRKFYSFLDTDSKLKVAFSKLIEKQLGKIPLEFLADLDTLNDNCEESAEIGYTGEALIYEALLKSKKFSKVIWLAKSDSVSSLSVTLNNGNTYYIEEAKQPYDILAEDFDENVFFFEIKSKKSFDSKKKLGLNLSRNQIMFANMKRNEKEHFVLAFALNVMDNNPILMFFKHSDNEFIDKTLEYSETEQ